MVQNKLYASKSVRGPISEIIHAERKVKFYQVLESELRNLSQLGIIVTLCFSFSTLFLGLAIDTVLYQDDATPPSIEVIFFILSSTFFILALVGMKGRRDSLRKIIEDKTD